MRKFFPLAILVISFFTACSSDNDEEVIEPISEQTLSGFVHGDPFLATGGMSSINGNESISINLTNTVADCSTNILDFVYSVSADVPNRIGFHRNVIVVFSRENETPLNVLNSIVEITEITETQVMGKIRSESLTEDNMVEGAFVLNVCTDQ
ncbi:hypothetical protein GTQ40_09975 [Flavobacteriaceae bacterium R38]|nr:hypothetical protein [Flavobacteriaceae bacterium R38]